MKGGWVGGRAKPLQNIKVVFCKRFANAKPCFALQFPLENTSVETVTTRELIRSVGRRRVCLSRCQSVHRVSSGQKVNLYNHLDFGPFLLEIDTFGK